jgi:hypothetical protein
MADIIDGFPGEENCIQGFTHLINLVAKSLLKLFEISKRKQGVEGEVGDAEATLRELASDLELEDMEMQRDAFTAGGDVGGDNEDDVVNKMAMMSEEDVKELYKAVLPITKALLKVSLEFWLSK